MMIATMCVSSCSTAKSVNKAFEKNGYSMTALTPAQQMEICPVIAQFPSFGYDAAGYLQVNANSCTFVYSYLTKTMRYNMIFLQNSGGSKMNYFGNFYPWNIQPILFRVYTYSFFPRPSNS